jgi:YidC/Oxa1 family membrane protein insertase
MNKTERIAVAVLIGLLVAWSYFGRRLMPPPPPPAVPAETVAGEVATDGTAVPAASGLSAGDATAPSFTAAGTNAVSASLPPSSPEVPVVRSSEQIVVELTNAVMRLRFTSWGGGLASASLNDYRSTIEADSGPVTFDFSDRIALSYTGLPGLSEADDFDIVKPLDYNGVKMSRTAENGLMLERTVKLEDGYAFTVTDRFVNTGATPVSISDASLQMGPMRNLESGPAMRGMVSLGVDALRSSDEKIEHIGKALPGLFGVRGGCSRANLQGVPLAAPHDVAVPLAWMAVKNKFFAQILAPDGGSTAARVRAIRADTPGGEFELDTVSASLALQAVVIEPGQTIERKSRYYVGPKEYARLKAEGNKRTEIMEFGRFFKPVCKVLLPLLNGIEAVVPGGYGMAIIILTIIVKLVFWPVTHKGTESMKRMQKLQPEIKKLRERYKSDPKKLQEKQMLLYREHKVNPLAGCLPMLIQIPVFIGLFTVLRSAVELRFTRFLWIRDLSEPEGLLAGVLPFPAGGLNILPLLMTATMVLQQRMTPSTGDPQQQKMMAFMPVMMLFIFYNMPSALVLYWTVSQGLSILQLFLQQRKDRLTESVAAPA